MSRKKTIEISGVNIVTQPHSPDKYVEIIRSINQKAVPVRGNEYLMISGLRPHLNNDWSTGIEGELVKFSNIDEHAQWVDLHLGNLRKTEMSLNSLHIFVPMVHCFLLSSTQLEEEPHIDCFILVNHEIQTPRKLKHYLPIL